LINFNYNLCQRISYNLKIVNKITLNSQDIYKSAINLKNTKKETVLIVDKDDNILGSCERFLMVFINKNNDF
jgi:hypothetical protein